MNDETLKPDTSCIHCSRGNEQSCVCGNYMGYDDAIEFAKKMNTMNDKTEGLYKKYRVERVDGSSAPGGKHEHCSYFVLDIDHDENSVAALRAYADSCESEYPELAKDLRRWLDRPHSRER